MTRLYGERLLGFQVMGSVSAMVLAEVGLGGLQLLVASLVGALLGGYWFGAYSQKHARAADP